MQPCYDSRVLSAYLGRHGLAWLGGAPYSASIGFQVTAPSLPLSSPSSSSMSSSSSEKSYRSIFERMRLTVADFGSGT